MARGEKASLCARNLRQWREKKAQWGIRKKEGTIFANPWLWNNGLLLPQGINWSAREKNTESERSLKQKVVLGGGGTMGASDDRFRSSFREKRQTCPAGDDTEMYLLVEIWGQHGALGRKA